jgi:hypothetical protein
MLLGSIPTDASEALGGVPGRNLPAQSGKLAQQCRFLADERWRACVGFHRAILTEKSLHVSGTNAGCGKKVAPSGLSWMPSF